MVKFLYIKNQYSVCIASNIDFLSFLLDSVQFVNGQYFCFRLANKRLEDEKSQLIHQLEMHKQKTGISGT